VFRDKFGAPRTDTSPDTPPSSSVPAAPARPPSETILGTDTQFVGTLSSKGHIRVDGTFHGPITTEGRILLTEQANIEGDLIGDSVMVSGSVRGDIFARKIAVMRTGRVWGNLRAEQLATEEGSFIQGQITMEVKVDVLAAIADRNAEKQLTEIDAAEAQIDEPLPEPVSVTVRQRR